MRTAELIGKTIADVTEDEYVGKDAGKSWMSWTQTTLHFTDGTTHSYTDDTTDVYDAGIVEPVDASEIALDDVYRDDYGTWKIVIEHEVLAHGTVRIDGEEFDPTYKIERKKRD